MAQMAQIGAQSQQNLGMDFGSGQTPSFSTFFPDYMDVDAANQQTHQHQHPATHALASSDATNNQATPTPTLQRNQIGRLGSPSNQTDSVNRPRLYDRPNFLSSFR